MGFLWKERKTWFLEYGILIEFVWIHLPVLRIWRKGIDSRRWVVFLVSIRGRKRLWIHRRNLMIESKACPQSLLTFPNYLLVSFYLFIFNNRFLHFLVISLPCQRLIWSAYFWFFIVVSFSFAFYYVIGTWWIAFMRF